MVLRALLIALVVLFVLFASNVHAVGELRLCGSEKQATWLTKVCTMKSETHPCLKESGVPVWNDICCAVKCSIETIVSSFCCFTQECLDKCYPGKGYKMGSVY